MKLALPKFQFRFVPAFGNVIHPGNFHPVGTQRAASAMVERIEGAGGTLEVSGQSWLVVGGSGGFGSAARAVLGAARGAHTLNVSLDGQPNPESSNKVRKIGSPGFHRNLAIERSLRALGTTARTVQGDAFDPELRESVIATIREHFGGKLHGLVWSLAAPRALDPRTGATVSSALKPLGRPVTVKTFTGRDERSGQGPQVAELELPEPKATPKTQPDPSKAAESSSNTAGKSGTTTQAPRAKKPTTPSKPPPPKPTPSTKKPKWDPDAPLPPGM